MKLSFFMPGSQVAGMIKVLFSSNEPDWQPHLASIWRAGRSPWLCFRRAYIVHYCCRYSLGHAVFQDCRAGVVAIRQKSSSCRKRHGLPLCFLQYYLVTLRRFIHCLYSSCLCRPPVCHHYRDPVCKATSQINGTLPDAIRQAGYIVNSALFLFYFFKKTTFGKNNSYNISISCKYSG